MTWTVAHDRKLRATLQKVNLGTEELWLWLLIWFMWNNFYNLFKLLTRLQHKNRRKKIVNLDIQDIGYCKRHYICKLFHNFLHFNFTRLSNEACIPVIFCRFPFQKFPWNLHKHLGVVYELRSIKNKLKNLWINEFCSNKKTNTIIYLVHSVYEMFWRANFEDFVYFTTCAIHNLRQAFNCEEICQICWCPFYTKLTKEN